MPQQFAGNFAVLARPGDDRPAMKLGEMLIEDGRLHEGQLVAALAQQSRDGGRIGTILYEQDLVDLDTLTVYLGLELGIPIATGAMLERAKKSAVRLLTPAQAFRYRCVPLMIQDHQLIVAVENPHELDTLDAIVEVTGYRVIPRVAPEIRIFYYLERYYGVPRPARYLRFGDKPRGDGPTAGNLPAPPLPGLPPVAKGPGPVAPQLHLRRAKTPEPVEDGEALELEAEDLIVALEADEAARAETAPIASAAVASAPAPSTTPAVSDYQPLAASAALALIASADDRGDVADALMGFAAGMFELAVLFIVRDNMAFGWRIAGAAPGRAHVDHVLIPLELPSLLHGIGQGETTLVSGALPPSPLHAHMFKVLGVAEPGHATAVAVSLGKRVVNILYGHRRERALTDDEVRAVQATCDAVAAAYARLIAVRKRPATA